MAERFSPADSGSEKAGRKNRRLSRRGLACAAVFCLCAAGAAAVFGRHFADLRRYGRAAYTQTFSVTNLKKWWLETGVGAADSARRYEESRAKASKVLLTPAFFGGTVYLNASGAPFVLSGTAPVALSRTADGRWQIPAAAAADFRAEYTRQKIVLADSDAQVQRLRQRLLQAERYTPAASGGVAYLANGQFVSASVRTYLEAGRQNSPVFLALPDVLPALGVSAFASPDGGSETFRFRDAAGRPHSFTVPFARRPYQPWTDPATGNVYPALIRVRGVCYLPESMLLHLFGFDVSDSDRTLTVVTDTLDAPPSVYRNQPMALDLGRAVPVAQAERLGLLDERGMLASGAQAKYDAAGSADSVNPAEPARADQSGAAGGQAVPAASQTQPASQSSGASQTGWTVRSLSANEESIVYGVSGRGAALTCYRLKNGGYEGQTWQRILMVFALHGFEDAYPHDGKVLTSLASRLIAYYSSHPEKLQGSELYIIPKANPDGEDLGWTNNGPGRCALLTRTDLNRDFPFCWRPFPSARNRTVSSPLQAVESRQLAELAERIRPDLTFDCHGWLDESLGDRRAAGVMARALRLTRGNTSWSALQSGFFAAWCQQRFHTPGVLLELPPACAGSDYAHNRAGLYAQRMENGLNQLIPRLPQTSSGAASSVPFE